MSWRMSGASEGLTSGLYFVLFVFCLDCEQRFRAERFFSRQDEPQLRNVQVSDGL